MLCITTQHVQGCLGACCKSIRTLYLLMSGIQHYDVTVFKHAHCKEPTCQNIIETMGPQCTFFVDGKPPFCLDPRTSQQLRNNMYLQYTKLYGTINNVNRGARNELHVLCWSWHLVISIATKLLWQCKSGLKGWKFPPAPNALLRTFLPQGNNNQPTKVALRLAI